MCQSFSILLKLLTWSVHLYEFGPRQVPWESVIGWLRRIWRFHYFVKFAWHVTAEVSRFDWLVFGFSLQNFAWDLSCLSGSEVGVSGGQHLRHQVNNFVFIFACDYMCKGPYYNPSSQFIYLKSTLIPVGCAIMCRKEFGVLQKTLPPFSLQHMVQIHYWIKWIIASASVFERRSS